MRSTRRDGIYWWCVRWERERLNVTMFCIRMRNLCVVYIVETVISFFLFRPYLQFRCGSCVLVLAFESAVRTHWRHKDCYIIFIENEHTHCKLCSIMPTAYASIKYEHLHRHRHTQTHTKTPNRDRERHRVWIRGIPCTTRTFTHTIKRQPQHAQVKSICRCILQPYGMDNFLYDDNWTNHSHTHTHTHACIFIWRFTSPATRCFPRFAPPPFLTLSDIFSCALIFILPFGLSIWPCECVGMKFLCIARECVFVHTVFQYTIWIYIYSTCSISFSCAVVVPSYFWTAFFFVRYFFFLHFPHISFILVLIGGGGGVSKWPFCIQFTNSNVPQFAYTHEHH